MTKGQRELWKMRFQEARLFAACFALCAIAMWVINRVLGWNMPKLLWLTRSAIVGFVVYVAYLFWSNHRRDKQIESSEGRRAVPLNKFLSNPDALIAPNHDEVTKTLHEWLLTFEKRGEGRAVLIIPNEDTPSAQHVFIIAPKLSQAERRDLLAFHADGISTLAEGKVKKLLPDLGERLKVYEVLWD